MDSTYVTTSEESLFKTEESVNDLTTHRSWHQKQTRRTRCCLCFDVKNGTTAIGFFQPCLLLIMLSAMVSFHHYWTIIFCLCPVTNFCFFIQLARQDNEKNKLKFNFSLLYNTPLMCIEQVIACVYRNTGGRCLAKELPRR
jgi:hypothetical protein